MHTKNQVQITLKVDQNLKEKALAKAKRDGITLKALIVMAMRGYLNNELSFGLHSKQAPSQYFLDTVAEAEKDLEKGDVHTFKNADEMIQHLQNV